MILINVKLYEMMCMVNKLNTWKEFKNQQLNVTHPADD